MGTGGDGGTGRFDLRVETLGGGLGLTFRAGHLRLRRGGLRFVTQFSIYASPDSGEAAPLCRLFLQRGAWRLSKIFIVE